MKKLIKIMIPTQHNYLLLLSFLNLDNARNVYQNVKTLFFIPCHDQRVRMGRGERQIWP